MEFAGEREGLGRLQTSARTGFFLHASLAVTPSREPLGILVTETWARQGRPRTSRNRRHVRRDPSRESLRWARGVFASEEALTRGCRAIHVVDREGDNYDHWLTYRRKAPVTSSGSPTTETW